MTIATSETHMMTLNAAGVGDITIDSAITLTANRTITIPLIIVKGGSITTSSSYALTINFFFLAGLFKVFTTTGTSQVIFGKGVTTKVHPQWWGALGDGSTDDSAAFNRMNSSLGAIPVAAVEIPSGDYIFNSGWNCTGKTGLVVRGQRGDTILRFATTGTPGIDLTGSTRARFDDLQIFGGSGSGAASVVVLCARTTSNSSAGWHKWFNCQIEGPNSGTTCKAVIYQFGSEDNGFYECICNVLNEDGVGLYHSSKNDLSIASAYQTIATGEQPNSNFHWEGGTICDYSTLYGGSTAYPVYLHNARDVSLNAICFWCSGDAFIYLKSDGPGQIVDTLSITNCKFEAGGATVPKYTIQCYSDNIGWSLGSLIANILNASDAFIYQPGSSNTFYCGAIQGNNFCGTAPTYFIDTVSGDIQTQGVVDAMRVKIRAANIYGGIYTDLAVATDFVTSGVAKGVLMMTSGNTERKMFFDKLMRFDHNGVFPITTDTMTIGSDSERFNELRATSVYATDGTNRGVVRVVGSKTQIGSQNGNDVECIRNTTVVGGWNATTFRWLGLPTYANNAAAVTGGLAVGDFYQDGANPSKVCVRY